MKYMKNFQIKGMLNDMAEMDILEFYLIIHLFFHYFPSFSGLHCETFTSTSYSCYPWFLMFVWTL